MQRISDFSYFLRTGRARPAERPPELKFNPWHDPEDGRFTFVGQGRYFGRGLDAAQAADGSALQRLAQYRPNPRIRMRGNGGPPLHDPKTLEQAFPGLRNAPAGAIIGVADNLLDLTGPAQRITTEISRAAASSLEREIQSLDPTFRMESLEPGGFPSTSEGQTNFINNLRLTRAKVYYEKGQLGPLQVETLRAIRTYANAGYELGLKELKAGKLKVRLSEREALGNFVDRYVRMRLRKMHDRLGIPLGAGQLVQVNRRENHLTEGSYSRPDARVGRVAFDVSLTEKTLATPQIRNFFRTEFQPTTVVIVRPSSEGPRSIYIITRPKGL